MLALTVALVAPYFIDWDGYRADFEREAGRILGRSVTVEGNVSVRLIPFPSVSFSDVRVGDPHKPPLMTIKTFSMDAEIAPLLSGKIFIYDMRIDHPRALLTVDRDGVVDWTIRPSTPFDPTQVTLAKVTVSDGDVEIIDNSVGRKHRITGLNATMSASTLAGPWRMNGTARLDGMQADLSIATSEVKSDGSLRLHARVAPRSLAAVVETDGDVTVKAGRIAYSGTFDIRSSDIAEGAGPGKETAKETSSAPGKGDRQVPLFSKVHVTGRFKADHAGLDIAEFRVEQGPADNPYVINGKARLSYGARPSFAISASSQQILLGGGAAQGNKQNAPKKTEEGSPFAKRLSTVKTLLASIPIPTIPGTVDLNLPAIVAGGTTIRDVAIKAEPAAGGWSIRRFRADLPGRTRVEASGKLLALPALSFDGLLTVASRQPSGLSTWLTGSVDDAVRRLSGAGFSAQVSLSRKIQSFRNLELAIGPTTLKGTFVRSVDGVARPFMKAELRGGALDADAMAALRSVLVSDAGVPRLQRSDIEVSLKAGPVSGAGLKAASVDTDFELNGGRLDVTRLMISDIAGATLTATGSVKPFSASPTGSIDATLLSPNLDGLVSALAARFPDLAFFSALKDRAAFYPGLLKDARLSVIGSAQRSGAGIELALTGHGKAGGARLSFSGRGRGPGTSFGSLDIDAKMEAKSAVGETLLALAGLPTLPLQMIGGVDGNLTLKGALDDGASLHLALSGAGTEATVEARLKTHDGDVDATGKAHLKSKDLDPYLAVTGHALPGFGDGLSADLASDFSLKGGKLDLSHLFGSIGGGAVSADLALSARDGVPKVKGQAHVDRIDLTDMAAFLLGPTAFEAATVEDWPDTPFSQAPSFPLDADVAVAAGKALLGSGAAIGGFSGRLLLDGGALSISDLKGQIDGGDLRGLVELRNNAGTALANAQLTLSGADLSSFYRRATGTAPFGGTVALSASLNSTGKSLAGMMASLSGSGVVEAKGLTIVGLDPGAFAPIVKASDAAGANVKPKQLAEIIGKHFPAGRFAAGNVDFPFIVAAGVARFSGVRIAASQAQVTARLRVDVSRDHLDGSGAFTFDPGSEVVAGAEPAVRFSFAGPIDDPKTTLDPQPLIQFLTQRSLEREQQRVEAMQAVLLQKQRLRREVQYYEARAAERKRLEKLHRKVEAQAQKQSAADEAARKKAAAEAAKHMAAMKRAAAEAARQKAAEDAVRKKSDEAAQQKALEEAQEKAILDALQKQKAATTLASEPAVKAPPARPIPADRSGAKKPSLAPHHAGGGSRNSGNNGPSLKFPATLDELMKVLQPNGQ